MQILSKTCSSENSTISDPTFLQDFAQDVAVRNTYTSADTESFVRGGPNLLTFSFSFF